MRQYQCPDCQASFPFQRDVNDHRRREHRKSFGDRIAQVFGFLVLGLIFVSMAAVAVEWVANALGIIDTDDVHQRPAVSSRRYRDYDHVVEGRSERSSRRTSRSSSFDDDYFDTRRDFDYFDTGRDLDCSDFDGPVIIRGSDPHGLDRDHDGIGCE